MKKNVAAFVLIMTTVGLAWSLPPAGGFNDDIIKITAKNQFAIDVEFYVNGKFACSAAANSSCTVRLNVRNAPFKFEAWGYNKTRVIASHTFTALAPGGDIIWATGNIELNAPDSPPTVANPTVPEDSAPTAPKSSAVSFMTSVATFNYQGRTQNRAQTVSLAKIERQTFPTRATYTLSGAGGFRIGKNGTAAFYGMSPVKVNRNLNSNRLSSDEKGLGLWLTVINGTLNGLTHRHETSGAWEEPIALSLGEAFPETIRARFRAQPLPNPDNKWILITADSGLISFQALDERYRDSSISGRYRGVLVYSPTEEAFLQAAAALTLFHGTDQFRIEQLHFAADASGEQLNPVLDVGSYLDFKPEAPLISAQGSFPSWCVQATQVFDIMHLAIMTAAEGSADWVPETMADASLLNWIGRDEQLMAKIPGPARAEEDVSAWTKGLDATVSFRKEEPVKAMYESAKDLDKDFILDLVPYGIGPFRKCMDKELYVVSQAVIDKMPYDMKTITALTGPAPQSAVPSESSQSFQREVNLIINSEPPNAKIYEEGKLIGTTPLNLANKYEVEMTMGNYSVANASKLPIQALLLPRSYTTSKDGFKPQTKSFQFSSPYQKEFAETSGVQWKGQPDFFAQPEFSLLFVLEPEEAKPQQQPANIIISGSVRYTESTTLTILTTPDQAEVYVDGDFVATTPASNLQLETGPHKIEIQKSGYKTWTRTMQVLPNSPVKIEITLEKVGGGF